MDFKSVLEFLKGKKSYLIIALLFLVNLAAGSMDAAGDIDWLALFSNPELAMQQLEITLLAAFRAGIAKIGT